MDWSLYQCLLILILVGIIFEIERTWIFNKNKLKRIIGYAVILVIFGISGISLNKGWPAVIELPSEFIFITGIVQQPSDTNLGRIFVWIRIQDDPTRPRSIELLYDPSLAVVIELAAMRSAVSGEFPVTDTRIIDSSNKSM